MLSTEMTVVGCAEFGAPEVMSLSRQPIPLPAEGEILIKVAAAGLNRADLMQRRGKYPPPPGASPIMGLEVSGIVAALGNGVQKWRVGDKVCALLAGGGYAEYAIVPETHCLPVPENLSLIEGAALPEAITTAYANIFEAGGLKQGEIALIQGGSSGIGTMAIQMVKAWGGQAFATAGSAAKAQFCRDLGATLAIDYKNQDFVEAVQVATHGRGVDVVLDMVGGSYVNRNLSLLAPLGRHVSIATQEKALAEIDIRLIMQKRLTVTGSTLRGRDHAEKARLITEIAAKFWPWVASGKIKPVIYQTFPLKNVVEAHKVMESGAHIGKIVLEVS